MQILIYQQNNSYYFNIDGSTQFEINFNFKIAPRGLYLSRNGNNLSYFERKFNCKRFFIYYSVVLLEENQEIRVRQRKIFKPYYLFKIEDFDYQIYSHKNFYSSIFKEGVMIGYFKRFFNPKNNLIGLLNLDYDVDLIKIISIISAIYLKYDNLSGDLIQTNLFEVKPFNYAWQPKTNS